MFLSNLLPATLLLFLQYLPQSTAAPTDIPSAASFYVSNLPDLNQDNTHPLHIFAGHISADPNAASAPATAVTSHLYFVLTKARRTADKERILFWFNGGPGCSSFDGLMMEIGPWRMNDHGGLDVAEGGWEEYTNIVYVDQPAGTGYSYTSTDSFVHELSDASDQFLEFLKNFYKTFPEYKHMDTYIAGESFAGQYIPYFCDALLNSTLDVPLKGAAIGNGWMDARRQYPAFLDYGLKHGILTEGSETYDKSKDLVDRCMKLLDEAEIEPIHIGLCERILGTVAEGRDRTVDGQQVCMNVYDVRLDDEYPACGMTWPPDLHNVTTYLDRGDVKSAIHATAKPESWTECQSRIGSQLTLKNSPSSITFLPRIIEQIPVMIFAGDKDFICNYVGLEAMIQNLEWAGAKGLGEVETMNWSVGGRRAGTWVESRGLTYAKIFNASHMVGFDLPHVAHDMILRFMGVNFSAIADGSARIPSSIGDVSKPVWVGLGEDAVAGAEDGTGAGSGGTVGAGGKTPEQDKAMWEAYYNAGSAAIVLVIFAAIIAAFYWFRIRRRRRGLGMGGSVGLPLSRNEVEESIPLTRSEEFGGEYKGLENGNRKGKGKERAVGEGRGMGMGMGKEDEDEEMEGEQERIFDVGDSDEEDEGRRR
ncbi:alpha/beta-hydrolase [Stereum hirsutum FP-91666 SS1]|uniref:alpha/beta-hydrolase n=1 Tax=Stereum hirsutum (strain FP-91666) TaxID=721885 RepID=UPI00044492F6|nr:alpha/beta-hydrolase [Stereum hirsutum FP-91666 SS1]EIM85643.1 alpha/beta-hydrolase [Stereum hirsutum FP-91666 SS1]